MSLAALVKGKGPSGFGYGSTAIDVTEGLDLRGQTMLVTGATSGIGRETARVLALRGAKVLVTGRSRERASQVATALEGDTSGYPCELGNPSSVRELIEAIKNEQAPLDAVICNAGVMAPPKLERVCGYELQFFTNHMGHFILTTGLLGHLSPRARVVMLSSSAHHGAPKGGIDFDNLSGEAGYAPFSAYGQSKLANLLHAKALARRMPSSTQSANAVHPGVIVTKLQRHLPRWARVTMSLSKGLFLKSVAQGAATQTFVATHPSLADVTGQYFADCNLASASLSARDDELAERLFEESAAIARRV